MKTKCYHELLKKKIELHESEKDSKKVILFIEFSCQESDNFHRKLLLEARVG